MTAAAERRVTIEAGAAAQARVLATKAAVGRSTVVLQAATHRLGSSTPTELAAGQEAFVAADLSPGDARGDLAGRLLDRPHGRTGRGAPMTGRRGRGIDVARTSMTVGGWTLVSRASGFLRITCIAAVLGPTF